jgi:hypothetical protein
MIGLLRRRISKQRLSAESPGRIDGRQLSHCKKREEPKIQAINTHIYIRKENLAAKNMNRKCKGQVY